MYRHFVGPHLDCGDMIYDEAYNETFHQKPESFKYHACLALSVAIRGSSRGRLLKNPSNVYIGSGNLAYFIKFSK